MKSLKAAALLILGPIVLGLTVTAGVAMAFRELRTSAEALRVFGITVCCGLPVFASIALACAFHNRLRPWIARHGFAVQWYASILMAFSLGCLFASVAHKTSNALTALAVLILFFCALAKLMFHIALRGDEPPFSGSGGPRPPLAPVPRPTGPPRRIFSEAAAVGEPVA